MKLQLHSVFLSSMPSPFRRAIQPVILRLISTSPAQSIQHKTSNLLQLENDQTWFLNLQMHSRTLAPLFLFASTHSLVSPCIYWEHQQYWQYQVLYRPLNTWATQLLPCRENVLFLLTLLHPLKMLRRVLQDRDSQAISVIKSFQYFLHINTLMNF